MNGSKIRDIIKAYNAKASYSAGITDVWGVSVTVRVDFAEKSGKALSYQFGHRHTELTLYSDDIDLFLFGTSAANAGETDIQTDGQQADPGVTNSGLPRRFYKRELGGDTEAVGIGKAGLPFHCGRRQKRKSGLSRYIRFKKAVFTAEACRRIRR